MAESTSVDSHLFAQAVQPAALAPLTSASLQISFDILTESNYASWAVAAELYIADVTSLDISLVILRSQMSQILSMQHGIGTPVWLCLGSLTQSVRLFDQ